MSRRNVRDYSREFIRDAETEIEKAVARTTIRVEAEAKRLTSQHSGPPASRPGEPPHVRTATGTRSIESETFSRLGEFTGRVGTNLRYFARLETGTMRIAPRPYLRPSLDSQRKRFADELVRAGRRTDRKGRR